MPQLRKIIKTRGHFPNDDPAIKLLWLALRNLTAKWERTAYAWSQAMNQLAILYGDRFTSSTTSNAARMDAAVPADAQNAPTGT